MKKLFLLLAMLASLSLCCGSKPYSTSVHALEVSLPATYSFQVYGRGGWQVAGTAVGYKPGLFRQTEVVTAAHVAELAGILPSRICLVEKPDRCNKVESYKLHPTDDIAKLQVTGKVSRGLWMEDTVEIGEELFVIGHPYEQFHVTSGMSTRVDETYIYTDARALPGNSGGPVVNKDGELVGIVSALRVLHNGQLESNYVYVVPIERINDI